MNEEFTLEEAIEIAKRNDPGENVPSVSRTLLAEIKRLNDALQYEQHRAEHIGTHGNGCFRWGPQHYQCALRYIDQMVDKIHKLVTTGEKLNAKHDHIHTATANILLTEGTTTNGRISYDSQLIRQLAAELIQAGE